MTLPFSPTSTRLPCRPISSHTSRNLARSPSSLVASKCRVRTRSSPCWLTPVSRPPPRCLRSSRQNIGGVAGYSMGMAEKCSRGAAPARITRRHTGPRLCRWMTTQSRLGWPILSTLAPIIGSSSCFILCRNPPSNGIGITSFWFGYGWCRGLVRAAGQTVRRTVSAGFAR